MLVVELALPWPDDVFMARAFPAGLGERLMAMWERHPETGLLAIAPDREHSRAGWSRVIDFSFPSPPRAAAKRAEYLVPHQCLGEFVAALFAGETSAAGRPGIEPVEFSGRDLLVCTHGTVDACCALFGYPLYRDVRQTAHRTARALRGLAIDTFRRTSFCADRARPARGAVLGIPRCRVGRSAHPP